MNGTMKIVLAGGTGFIGGALSRTLAAHGHELCVLSRRPESTCAGTDPAIRLVTWNGRSRGDWERMLDGADAVINLAGEPIADRRWTTARKQALRDSRIGPTRALVDAMAAGGTRPRLLINASGVGFYGPQDAGVMSETSPAGKGFLSELCRVWEQEAQRAESFGSRVVRLRIGMVLGRDGGALSRMALPFRLFLGGPVSPGTQWVSWIHREDLIGLIEWALATPSVTGPVNAVAPEPVTMTEFCAHLGHTLHRPSWLPVPGFALRVMLGEMAEMLTTGQRVHPTVAVRGRFSFAYPTLRQAFHSIFNSPHRRSTG